MEEKKEEKKKEEKKKGEKKKGEKKKVEKKKAKKKRKKEDTDSETEEEDYSSESETEWNELSPSLSQIQIYFLKYWVLSEYYDHRGWAGLYPIAGSIPAGAAGWGAVTF